MSVVKTVLADICQADVVTEVGIEHVKPNSTAQFQAAVKSVKVAVLVGAERFSRAIVLDITICSHCQIAAGIGLNTRLIANEVLVFENQGHLQIVEVIGER